MPKVRARFSQKTNGEDEGVEGKVFRREKRKILSKEIGENETEIALDLLKENASRWIEICRESIEH